MGYKHFTVYIGSTDDFFSPDDMLDEICEKGESGRISEYKVSFRDDTDVLGYRDHDGHILLADSIAWGEASADWSREGTITIITYGLFGEDGEIEDEVVVRVDVR